jgi:hypothetical protein
VSRTLTDDVRKYCELLNTYRFDLALAVRRVPRFLAHGRFLGNGAIIGMFLATSFAFCFNSGSSSILVVHQLEALDHVRNRKRCLILPMMKQRLPRRSRTRPEVDRVSRR